MSLKDLHPEAHQQKVEKKNVVFIWDSMKKNNNGRDGSSDDSVKIQPHPVASTQNLIDHIKPGIRKKTCNCGYSYSYK